MLVLRMMPVCGCGGRNCSFSLKKMQFYILLRKNRGRLKIRYRCLMRWLCLFKLSHGPSTVPATADTWDINQN